MKALINILIIVSSFILSTFAFASSSNYFDKIIHQRSLEQLKLSGDLDNILKALDKSMGHGEGNGGDYLRSNFLKVGSAILFYLEDSEFGKQFSNYLTLDILKLQQTLDTKRITVVKEVLVDNTGSLVDAIGMQERILLNYESWYQHFSKQRDIYYLVFHEMLRSAGINDDEYIISKHFINFPNTYKVQTATSPFLPLANEQILSGLFNPSLIQIGGSGCKNGDAHKIEFDFENNILEVSPQNYYLEVGAMNKRKIMRKSCSLAIPFEGRSNKRVVISMIDLKGKVHLSKNTSAKFQFEGFTPANKGDVHTKEFDHQQDQNLLAGVLIRESQVFKTNCSEGSTLRLNTSVLIKNLKGRTSHAQVDQIKIYLQLEDC